MYDLQNQEGSRVILLLVKPVRHKLRAQNDDLKEVKTGEQTLLMLAMVLLRIQNLSLWSDLIVREVHNMLSLLQQKHFIILLIFCYAITGFRQNNSHSQ